MKINELYITQKTQDPKTNQLEMSKKLGLYITQKTQDPKTNKYLLNT